MSTKNGAAGCEVSTHMQKLLSYRDFYEDQLEQVVAFWLKRTLDRDHGGYLVPISRMGVVSATDKNMWCQARQTWMFSAMYNHIEPRDEWLNAARLGRDFMVKYGYRGEGRWAYLLDREGNLLNDSRSLTTDNNSAMALGEFARASKSDEDVPIIRATIEQYVQRLGPPAVCEWYHHDLSTDYIWNAIHMVTLGGIPAIRPFFDPPFIDSLASDSVERILFTFAKDEYQTLFEALAPNGDVVKTEIGLRVNPGHAIESTWFCMEEGIRRNDRRFIDRASEVCRWSYELGWDKQFGGILAFTTPGGGRPPGPESPNPWGERWDDKVWWVHSEALYGLALSAATSNDPWFVDAFDELHQYVIKHFIDHEYGEWYQYLDRHGEAQSPVKGSWIKCMFHIPRNLMKIVLLLRHLEKRGTTEGLIA
jgi:N-acylglucosamine 2-epimerase